ncbi:hypothetical protein [[Mycobacterium] vasticus]|uniref:MFS transporter n=1 Tax=[Mycobacterium] vasticus TaxID=2875777 RepID=A0ABU5Z1Z0_9MYCO|nr:hypothetical protein [Mycolicibacter sp. MYC017]MEB3071412.1 hypothetical protein [Mycolicibacter sp. MYC017]
MTGQLDDAPDHQGEHHRDQPDPGDQHRLAAEPGQRQLPDRIGRGVRGRLFELLVVGGVLGRHVGGSVAGIARPAWAGGAERGRRGAGLLWTALAVPNGLGGVAAGAAGTAAGTL